MEVSKVDDAILSAWKDKGEVLTYSKIKRHLVAKGIITKTNDRSPSRWLKRLVEKSVLKRASRGYILEMKPKAYQVFDYLSEIREKYGRYIYEGEVGGFISHIDAATYLNFDDTLLRERDEKIALNVISVRMAELFWALYSLRNTVIKRRCGLDELELPEEIVREIVFAALRRSNEHTSTDELVQKYFQYLYPYEKEALSKFAQANNPKTAAPFMHLVGEDFFLDEMPKDLKEIRKHLKRTASIDIDRYTIDELKDKFVQISEWIEKKHQKEMREQNGYMYTREESELEANYRMAIQAKVLEGIKALGTNLEDFAVILTRHPATMNQYYTPEHILYEAFEWAKKAPEDDEWGKRLWQEIHNEEKTFEGMVAERLNIFRRFDSGTYAKFRTLPWVKRELSKYGDFNTILKLYSKKHSNAFMKKKVKCYRF